MSITNKMLNKIDEDITNLKHGLHPENLDYWYKKIIEETIEIVPPWLVDKINIKQDKNQWTIISLTLEFIKYF